MYGEELKTNDLLYRGIFQKYDPDGTGIISLDNVIGILGEIGRQVTREEVVEILNHVDGTDQNEREVVTFNELTSIVSLANTHFYPEEEVYLVFRYFDKNGDGYIDHKELKALFLALGDEPTEAEILEMIREADKDGDGKVSYSEFVDVISHTIQCDNSPTVQIPLTDTNQDNPEKEFQDDTETQQEKREEKEISDQHRERKQNKKKLKKMALRRQSCYDFGSTSQVFSRSHRSRVSLPNLTVYDKATTDSNSRQSLSATFMRRFFKKKKMSI